MTGITDPAAQALIMLGVALAILLLAALVIGAAELTARLTEGGDR
jgi:hypothetical protein